MYPTSKFILYNIKAIKSAHKSGSPVKCNAFSQTRLHTQSSAVSVDLPSLQCVILCWSLFHALTLRCTNLMLPSNCNGLHQNHKRYIVTGYVSYKTRLCSLSEARFDHNEGIPLNNISHYYETLNLALWS